MSSSYLQWENQLKAIRVCRLAMVQGGGSTSSNSDEPPSKLKLRSPTTVRNHVTRDFQLQQVRLANAAVITDADGRCWWWRCTVVDTELKYVDSLRKKPLKCTSLLTVGCIWFTDRRCESVVVPCVEKLDAWHIPAWARPARSLASANQAVGICIDYRHHGNRVSCSAPHLL